MAAAFARRSDKRTDRARHRRAAQAHHGIRPAAGGHVAAHGRDHRPGRARDAAQGKKIVAELQVLESLMREFAGKISRSCPRPAGRDRARQRDADRPPPGHGRRLCRQHRRDAGDCWKPSAPAWRKTASIFICSPSSACRKGSCAIYEALSRLRAEDGSVIMPAQYIKVAAPAGPDERGRQSSAVPLRPGRAPPDPQEPRASASSATSPATRWRDTEFFPQFLEYMQANRDLAGPDHFRILARARC